MSQHLEKLFSHGLQEHELRIEARRLQALAQAYQNWQGKQSLWPAQDALLPCHFLRQHCAHLAQEIQDLRTRHGVFKQDLNQHRDPQHRRDLLLTYAAQLGSRGLALRADARALRRWFGPDALEERYVRVLAELERVLSLSLRQLGRLSAQCLQHEPRQGADRLPQWSALQLEESLWPMLEYLGNPQIRTDAMQCLLTALSALPLEQQENLLHTQTLHLVYQAAQNLRADTWLQCAALQILAGMATGNFIAVAESRLRAAQESGSLAQNVQNAQDADLFVRRRIVDALPHLAQEPRAALLKLARRDPSPWVRQGVVLVLAGQACAGQGALLLELYPQLLLHDAEPKVRAQAAWAMQDLLHLQQRQIHGQPLPLLDWLCHALQHEKHQFVLRTLLALIEACVRQLAEEHGSQGQAQLALWLQALNPHLERLHREAEFKVRRWTAQCAECLWLYADARHLQLLPALRSALSTCAVGSCIDLPTACNAFSAARLARMLAVLARADFGLSLEQTRHGWRLWRGQRFGFRLWRALHEWRHPSPDKRQAFRHTIGRIFRGEIRIPSPILAEMSETKVPGEPLQLESEGGWRPYLPLVDELISSLQQADAGTPLRIVSAEGITELQPPQGLLRRLQAKIWLTRNFALLAQLRNWREDSQASPDSYLKKVQELGFKVKFQAHRYAPQWRWQIDPAVGRFFAAALLPASLPAGLSPELRQQLPVSGADFWLRFQNYFFSSYDNSLFDLALFVSLALAWFFGSHIWQNRRMRQARKNVPLVVGGWGTRGKSGTERIKAALFNGLGYTVVSKTTGCEAMFLYGHPQQRLREMFLFRPYDKATIWEQHHLLRLSNQLGCEVFLWECMALTPDFVQLLQRSWMRDDISTITNTFPDHEDLQGPAGINIPQVMTNFIPKGGVLLTSEEQMRPILRDAADKLGTRLSGTGWLESGLLPPDVLARFPYQEHPDNIALVLALARELGVAPDFALKEMADRVIPDLGVLKTYPQAQVEGRRLIFVNGMSANERFGCLGNWTRLGFDRVDAEQEAGVFLSTVVNNRGDRIARSRVFANILVEDLRADKHFLIGSNLAGLQGYIREAWEAHAAKITLWVEGGDAQQVLTEFARHLRICHTRPHLQARLRAMLAGQNLACNEALLELVEDETAMRAALQGLSCPRLEENLQALAQMRQSMAEYQAFAQRLQQGGDKSKLDQEFRHLLWQWFARKLVVVEDYYASGDSIIHMLAQHIPPGCENRVMGIQNIKGTGLGFIYCWQAWDACWQACRALLARDPQQQEQGLAQLVQMQDFGILAEQHLQDCLQQARVHPGLQSERQQAQLSQIEQHLQQAMRAVRAKMGTQAAGSWQESLCAWLEGWLDAPDAVLRRRKANRIYADLASERISHARAALELQELTQRQKGGWLYRGGKEKRG